MITQAKTMKYDDLLPVFRRLKTILSEKTGSERRTPNRGRIRPWTKRTRNMKRTHDEAYEAEWDEEPEEEEELEDPDEEDEAYAGEEE